MPHMQQKSGIGVGQKVPKSKQPHDNHHHGQYHRNASPVHEGRPAEEAVNVICEGKAAAVAAQKDTVDQGDEESQRMADQQRGEVEVNRMIEVRKDQQDLHSESVKNQRSEGNKAKCDKICRVLFLRSWPMRWDVFNSSGWLRMASDSDKA